MWHSMAVANLNSWKLPLAQDKRGSRVARATRLGAPTEGVAVRIGSAGSRLGEIVGLTAFVIKTRW